MVIYDLICDIDHAFEGWFKNAEDFQSQSESGLLTCPVCGSEQVSKKLTAAKLTKKSNSGTLPAPQRSTAQQVVSADTQSPEKFAQLQKMLGRVHGFVEQNFEDVGNKFAEKAISMHKGEEEQANIRGIASKDQVKKMAEEGVEAVALPPKPIDPDKVN